MARPDKWDDAFVHTAEKAALLGATDREIAEILGVSERTLNYWKKDHAELVAALSVGKEAADARVEQSLYRRALGYSHDAMKFHLVDGEVVETPYTEHYAPDTTAAIFWLKNRKPDDWREKSEVAHSLSEDMAAWLGQR